jgi:phage gp36-like protein
MAYCTLADLQLARKNKLLIELTDGTTVPIAGVIAAAIAAADAEIEGRLRVRYPHPLPTVPDEVKFCSIALALNWLYGRRDTVPETVTKETERWRTWLENIRDGKAVLPDIDQSLDTSACLSADYEGRAFDPDTLLGGE